MLYHDRSNCGRLGSADIGKTVHLAGWVDALRDHGEVFFIPLRDQSGIVQLVFSSEFAPEAVCRHFVEATDIFRQTRYSIFKQVRSCLGHGP